MTSRDRKRLNALPEKVARRIDDAILDLADGLVEGEKLSRVGGFGFANRYGDWVVYDIDAKHLYVDDFTTAEER